MLILDSRDLAVLIAHKPDIGARLEQVVKERAGAQTDSMTEGGTSAYPAADWTDV